MNILLSTIGRRDYLADYFRHAMHSPGNVIGTSDRHDLETEFTSGLLACDLSYVVPSIKSSDYVDALLALCAKEQINMMTSLFDQDCHILSNHLEQFHSIGVTTFIPDRKVSDICFDKMATHRFLEGIGVGSPETFVSIHDFLQSAVSYPVIIKPRFGFASLNMHMVKNDMELQALFDENVHIIQKVLPGEEYGFDILTDLDGKVVSCVVKRKLKMRSGETDQAITVKNDKLLALAVSVGESLGHTGLLDVDVFVDRDDIFVLEFNPRFGGGYPLAHAAGACFPELMIDIALGKQPKLMVGDYKEGIVLVKAVKPITMPVETMLSSCQRFSL